VIYMAGGNAYTLVHEHKNGWNPEAFRDRFSEVLERYDYIVGDWGYNQLRLRGFFRHPQPKAAKDSHISCLSEYINEYCNFGCAYFVLEKIDLKTLPEGTPIMEEGSAAKADAGASEVGDASAPAAMAEAGAAAMAATPSGMLLRWPLKERPGGRVPGTSPSAVARAVSEGAERRAAAAAAQAAASGRPDPSGGRTPREAGSGGGRPRGDGGGRDRRPLHYAGGGSRSGGRQERGPGGPGGGPRGLAPHPARDGGGERQSRHTPPPGAGPAGGHGPAPQSGGEGGGPSPRGGGNSPGGGGRWGGKNRRRSGGAFHSAKPNRPRPEGTQRFEGPRRPDAGTSDAERP